MRIGAIILAAGEGKRLNGRIKALIQIGSATFLDKAISLLDSPEICERIVVLGYKADEVKRALTFSNVSIAINDFWKNGMTSSLKVGTSNLSKNLDGFMVMPVDLPLLKKETLIKTLETFQKDSSKIVRPRYRKIPGHPVIFPIEFVEKIIELDDNLEPNTILKRSIDRVKYFDTDQSCVKDLDTEVELDLIL